ncbi:MULTISPECIES: hypothetical protein [Virgibacillus]|uniref:Uncharacterized protein n=1 Tax=Virgibacillus massiliensis TaxID=1462526 RepID=A0A024QH12_9BACI|nr:MULTISPECIES: hypothetical protein [Virgibacillus]EQB34821.1 hypothetical protein M948_20815 [Virgibacillus sp. CM-4]CDQ41460.1 hypothetical protein BN990_03833 [Virgibacillus massiliensis]
MNWLTMMYIDRSISYVKAYLLDGIDKSYNGGITVVRKRSIIFLLLIGMLMITLAVGGNEEIKGQKVNAQEAMSWNEMEDGNREQLNIMSYDVTEYINTIDSESPAYDTTKDLMEQMEVIHLGDDPSSDQKNKKKE